MKTKKQNFKIGQEVMLPNGETGKIVEEMPIGELRIVSKKDEFYLYPEDLPEQEGGLNG